MQRRVRDGNQRVPFLVPIQLDQISWIECQSVILVFAFNNTRRGRLAGWGESSVNTLPPLNSMTHNYISTHCNHMVSGWDHNITFIQWYNTMYDLSLQGRHKVSPRCLHNRCNISTIAMLLESMSKLLFKHVESVMERHIWSTWCWIWYPVMECSPNPSKPWNNQS